MKPQSETGSVAFVADFPTFCDHVEPAEFYVHIVAPGLEGAQVETLVVAAGRQVDVRVVLDVSEATERNGFGSIPLVDDLRLAGIEVRHLTKNAVSFVIADRRGYLLFPRSRQFQQEGEGLNAIRLNGVMVERLSQTYFAPRDDEEEEVASDRMASALADLIVEDSRSIQTDTPIAGVGTIDEKSFEEAKEALRKNPARDPDMTRRFSAYTTKLQFVDMVLKGGSFDSQSVSWPDEFPLGVSEKLQARLTAKMRVFDRDDLSGISAFQEFKKEVKKLKDEYTEYLPSRDRRILDRERKAELLKKVEKLESRIEPLKKDIARDVVQAVGALKIEMKDEAFRLLEARPTEDGQLFVDDPVMLADWARQKASTIVEGIRFPEHTAVTERIGIQMNFYDLTWEDFYNEEFIEELLEKEMIETKSASELRDLRDSIELKPLLDEATFVSRRASS